MSTKNKWLIGIGIVLLLAVMYALPFVLQSTAPAYGGGYGMMGGGRGGMMGGGMHGGMMSGGMMGSGMMGGYSFGLGYGLMWLVPLALLTLIGLSIAALIKYLRSA
jgi:hypothetical protein